MLFALFGCAVAFAQVTPIKPNAYDPPEWCHPVLGKNINVGLKNRTLAVLEAGDYFPKSGSFRTQSVYFILMMLGMPEKDWNTVLAKTDQSGNTLQWMRLYAAVARSDWEFGYDEAVATQSGLVGIFYMARKEAIAKARTGNEIFALRKFREKRTEYLKKDPEDDDLAKKIQEETKAEDLLAITILRDLIMLEHDQAASDFIAQNNLAHLQPFVDAMIIGRQGEVLDLANVFNNAAIKSVDWVENYKDGYTLFSEFAFQSIAAKRWDLAGKLSDMNRNWELQRALLTAAKLAPILIENSNEEALLLLIGLLHQNDRPTYSFTQMSAILALRGDTQTLERLRTYLTEQDKVYGQDLKNDETFPALVLANLLAGNPEKALSLMGDKTLTELLQGQILLEGKTHTVSLGGDIGNMIAGALALYQDETKIGGWQEKLDERQQEYVSLLRVAAFEGWEAGDRRYEEKKSLDLFRGNWPIHRNYFVMFAAFKLGHADDIKAWYDWAIKEPTRRYRYLDEWLSLAYIYCIGFPVAPFESFETISHDYRLITPAIETTSSYIIEDK